MAKTRPVLFHLTESEYNELAERAVASGINSPALYMRALYRESLGLPDNVRRAHAHAEITNIMRNEAARLVAEFLRGISTEELLGAATRQE